MATHKTSTAPLRALRRALSRPLGAPGRAAALASTLAATLALGCGGGPEPAPTEPTAAPTSAAAALAPVDRSKLPEPAAAGQWAPPAVTTFKLANGVEVWHLEQRQAPLLSLRLLLPNGAATDPPDQAGLTALMADLLDEGAGARDALAVADAFQRLATDYGVDVGTDVTEFTLHLLADKLDPSLALLADVLLRPRLDPAEFERRKAQRIAAALAAESDPGQTANALGRRVLFGTGYGGHTASGNRTTLANLSLDAIKAHRPKMVAPAGAVLVAVGAVDRATLEAALNRHLGEWKGSPAATPRPLAPASAAPAIYAVDFPGASQTNISVLRRVPGTRAGDDFPGKVFNWTLGGAFTSRLNLNLREDKGYTYGARAGFSRWLDAGVYSLGAQVKAETTRASLDEIFKELADIVGARPITADEFAQAKGGLLKSFPSRFEQMHGVASLLGSVFADGRTPAWLQAWPEKLAAVTLPQAQAEAQAQAGATDFVVVIAGDLARVGPTLLDLGRPIFVHDAQGNPIGPWTPPAVGSGAKPGAQRIGAGRKGGEVGVGAKEGATAVGSGAKKPVEPTPAVGAGGKSKKPIGTGARPKKPAGKP